MRGKSEIRAKRTERGASISARDGTQEKISRELLPRGIAEDRHCTVCGRQNQNDQNARSAGVRVSRPAAGENERSRSRRFSHAADRGRVKEVSLLKFWSIEGTWRTTAPVQRGPMQTWRCASRAAPIKWMTHSLTSGLVARLARRVSALSMRATPVNDAPR